MHLHFCHPTWTFIEAIIKIIESAEHMGPQRERESEMGRVKITRKNNNLLDKCVVVQSFLPAPCSFAVLANLCLLSLFLCSPLTEEVGNV